MSSMTCSTDSAIADSDGEQILISLLISLFTIPVAKPIIKSPISIGEIELSLNNIISFGELLILELEIELFIDLSEELFLILC